MATMLCVVSVQHGTTDLVTCDRKLEKIATADMAVS